MMRAGPLGWWRRGPWAWVCVVLLSLLFARSAAAIEVPPLEKRVTDLAQVLQPQQEAAIEALLAAHERGTGHQFAVLTIPGLEGESLEDFSLRVVESWKLGGKDDDGLLLLVAIADRSVRIEVGYGLEGDVPDLIAGRVIRETLRPAFRHGDYAGGIDAGLRRLMEASGWTPPDHLQPLPAQRAPPEPEVTVWDLLLSLVIVLGITLLLLAGRRGGHGGGGGGGGLVTGLLLGSMLGGRGGGGFSGGGFGGGGGFSGGGGGFGGGGASGGW